MIDDRLQIIEDRLNKLERSDRYTLEKLLQLLDGRNIQVGTKTGTIIATEPTQKLGFWGNTPVAQQTKAGHNNWAALSDVVSALVNLGLVDQ